MKIRVDANNRYLYPDVSGLCGRPEYLDDARDVLVNPSLIIEVLSKSTEAYDRGRKLAIYMALPTVSEIALVSLVELRVDKYTRQPDGIWRFDGFSGPETSVPFVFLGGAVSLREVYDGIELEPLAPEPGSERIR
jgi:Uma2 family endonuclease